MTKPRNERLWDACGQFALTLHNEGLTDEQAEQACVHVMSIFRGLQEPQQSEAEWRRDFNRRCADFVAQMERDMARELP